MVLIYFLGDFSKILSKNIAMYKIGKCKYFTDNVRPPTVSLTSSNMRKVKGMIC